jgi:hypothetical protein
MKSRLYYLLKVKGLGVNADFIQIRNEEFELVANLSCTPPYQSLGRFFRNPAVLSKALDLIKQLGYGELKKIEI